MTVVSQFWIVHEEGVSDDGKLAPSGAGQVGGIGGLRPAERKPLQRTPCVAVEERVEPTIRGGVPLDLRITKRHPATLTDEGVQRCRADRVEAAIVERNS